MTCIAYFLKKKLNIDEEILTNPEVSETFWQIVWSWQYVMYQPLDIKTYVLLEKNLHLFIHKYI